LLFISHQSSPEVVPTMWFDTFSRGSGKPCALPDGTRFTEGGSLTQYISIRGASLPLSYGDAQAYDGEGNAGVATMAPGYVSGHPASGVPANTIVRVVGVPQQYLFDGNQLGAIGSPDVSGCLLSLNNQSAPEVVPTAWSDGVPIGPGAQCGSGQPSQPSGSTQQQGASTAPPPDHSTPPPAAKVALTRSWGSDRSGTAVAISQLAFVSSGSAGAVVLARKDDFADALTGGVLAAKTHGPVLLTSPTGLDISTRTEMQRVLPPPQSVYLIGGPGALSDQVASDVASLGYAVTRVSGDDRYRTAVAVAQTLGNPKTVFEATGLNYPDALAAVPAAVQSGGAILLTADGQEPAATANYLQTQNPSARWAVGGKAAAADPSAHPLVGSDRYTTAIAVDQQFFASPTALGVASGLAFPDGLAAGPLLGSTGHPLVLVPSDGQPPQSVKDYLSSVASSVSSVEIFGGESAVSTYAASWVAGTA
jgi:hypothetical protein